MSVKEHYDNHLGRFYSWMSGNFDEKVKENKQFFESNNIIPNRSGVAIDLGAAHGIQSVALANLGFNVKSVDFNRGLLDELKINSKGLNVEIIEDDIRNVLRFAGYEPEVIVCMGDTLTHLESKADIGSFIKDISETLAGKGQLILSFRDYSNELTNDNRFILVKSDSDRILTCFLEYQTGSVRVTDLLYEKRGNSWEQKVSSYTKVRVSTDEIINYLESNSFSITLNQISRGMTTLIAKKTFL